MAVRLVSFSATFKYRDKILQQIRPYVDTVLTGQTFVDFFADVLSVLPVSVSRDAVFETLRLLAGSYLDYRSAVIFAWRLGGNIHRLNAGQVVAQWSRQIADEWVPLKILGVEPFLSKNKPGYLLHCMVLAGSPATIKFTQFISRPSAYSIARTCGFTDRRGKKPFAYQGYLTNLVFYGLLDAAKSEEKPYFTEVRKSSAAVAHNKELLDIRYRLVPCLRNYQHDCRSCLLGYDECPAAVRAKTLVQKACAICRTDTYFELRAAGECCIVCGQPADVVIGRRPTS